MSIFGPQEIVGLTIESGTKKAALPLASIMILGFLAGSFIALGFLLDIHVSSYIPPQWASFGNLLGAAVFPIGLILVVLAGGELLTGNMMSLPVAMFAKRISARAVAKNWFLVTVANFAGALFVAYFFGHVVGLTEGAFLGKTVSTANAKLHDGFSEAFLSGIGCNWLVCLAIWLSYASKDVAGKVIAMWFPIMTFVAIGFQHVVANMFVIPAAIFAGAATWFDFGRNFIPVFLGNAAGGAIFVGLAYYTTFGAQIKKPAGSLVMLTNERKSDGPGFSDAGEER